MTVLTYHCLCTELVLATTVPIKDVPTRESDNSLICTSTDGNSFTPGTSILKTAVTTDELPVVLKLEDGFEKRYLVKCGRCGLTLGYQLDLSQFEGTKEKLGRREEVVYLLPGGLVSTEDVRAGRKMDDAEVEAVLGKVA